MKGRFNQILNTSNDFAAGICFSLMFIVVFGAVVLRYLFNFSFQWSDELSRYLFVYMIFLGIPIAFRERIHVIIEFFILLLPKKVNSFLRIFCDLLIAVTIIYIGYYTIIKISGPLGLGRTVSPALKIPMSYLYASVFICFGLLLIEIIQRFIIKGYRQRGIDVDKNKYL